MQSVCGAYKSVFSKSGNPSRLRSMSSTSWLSITVNGAEAEVMIAPVADVEASGAKTEYENERGGR